MAQIETRDELNAEQIASMTYYAGAESKGGIGGAELIALAFRNGWLAGRDWARNQEMLAQIEEQRQRAEQAEHSDAPWRFDAVPHRAGHGIEGHILPHGAGVDDPCVAYVEGVGSVDLALMLAAPDLLAALEAMLAEFGVRLSDGKPLGYTVGSMDRALKLVRDAEAAITKAKGA